MAIFSVLAVVAGAVAVYRDVKIVWRGGSRPANLGWERFGLVAALVCAVFGFLIIRNGSDKANSSILVFGAAQLALAGATILVFLTRWRRLTEGLAAVALGVLSFLTGFSIGIFFMPFAVALGVGALNHSDPRVYRSP
jgi:hypothetical protein